MEQPIGSQHERFANVVADWQRKLLQLDRRNNLLYFKARTTAIRIADHSPDTLLTALSSHRSSLTFDYAEARHRRRPDLFTHLDTQVDQGQEPHVREGDLRGDCPPLELQRRLGNLRRRARQWQEEQGLNVLFLAMGFLHWVDEDGEKVAAPLLLLPCRLDRESPRDCFTLVPEEEELTTNSTLAVKLEEFGIKLPETESEEPKEYFEAVREQIEHRTDWEVQEYVVLATFAYSKLAMWRDLQVTKDNGTEHMIVQALAGIDPPNEGDATPSATPRSLPEDLAGACLDDILEVRDQFAVLPADYSQLLTITKAKEGVNLVVHGPPGTGKSQTIANIISTFIAEGKTVLFASEKTAALDVVKRRLNERALGIFCLDLHSERGNKANVYEQFRQALDDGREVQQLEFDYAALTERRLQLNQVVRSLHQIRQPLGRTPFQMQGRFAALGNVPHVPFTVAPVQDLSAERLRTILARAERVKLRPREFREHWTSHWRALKTRTPSLALQDKIRSDMGELSAGVAAGQAAAIRLADALGQTAPETPEGLAWLTTIAGHFAKAPGIPRNWVQGGVVSDLRVTAEREAKGQTERRHLTTRLQEAFGPTIPE